MQRAALGYAPCAAAMRQTHIGNYAFSVLRRIYIAQYITPHVAHAWNHNITLISFYCEHTARWEHVWSACGVENSTFQPCQLERSMTPRRPMSMFPPIFNTSNTREIYISRYCMHTIMPTMVEMALRANNRSFSPHNLQFAPSHKPTPLPLRR